MTKAEIVAKVAEEIKISKRSEHTSELLSPDTISYAVFCLDRKSVV